MAPWVLDKKDFLSDDIWAEIWMKISQPWENLREMYPIQRKWTTAVRRCRSISRHSGLVRKLTASARKGGFGSTTWYQAELTIYFYSTSTTPWSFVSPLANPLLHGKWCGHFSLSVSIRSVASGARHLRIAFKISQVIPKYVQKWEPLPLMKMRI